MTFSCPPFTTIVLVLTLIFSASANSLEASTETQLSLPDNHWLTHAASDQQRFERLETYLRGFDQPMWEVGERFSKMASAVDRNNYSLAIYHWKKIRKTIINGLMKRPARRANAEAILLSVRWKTILNELKKEDQQSAAAALNKAAMVCIACHAAESVSFVNDQPLFDRFTK